MVFQASFQKNTQISFGQSAGAVEYTNYFFAEE